MKKLHEKILSVLCDDARMPLDTVAAMIGEEEAVVKAAVADMEQSGIIVKYTAIVNDERAGKSDVEALIEVKVSPVRETGFDEIAQYIYQFPEVKSVFLMSGAYDLAVFVEGKSLRDCARFVSEKLSGIDKVLSCATHFILKKYKTEGVVLDSSEEKRLVVQP